MNDQRADRAPAESEPSAGSRSREVPRATNRGQGPCPAQGEVNTSLLANWRWKAAPSSPPDRRCGTPQWGHDSRRCSGDMPRHACRRGDIPVRRGGRCDQGRRQDVVALVLLSEGPDSVNLKCEPGRALELRAAYAGIRPGYHQNKQHWNTVDLDGSVEDDVVLGLGQDSYDLVVAGLPRTVRAGWRRTEPTADLVVREVRSREAVAGLAPRWRRAGGDPSACDRSRSWRTAGHRSRRKTHWRYSLMWP